ncbi:MAG: MBOAT family protein [Polyangiaceae bacterium]|nr:MBOAT family protein [Polyangiaceae bacterium]
MTFRDAGLDPLLLGLRALKVPVGETLPFNIAAFVLAPITLVALLRAKKIRMIFILIASYVFYAHWDWRFLPLIWASSTIDWLLGNGIASARSQGRRRLWIVGTVAVNLTVLGIFKYFNFGVETARAVLGALGYHPPEIVLQVALPVGISFFTFESMSYVIDIYRGQIKPQKSYVEYLSFVAFFPHLVAGPIVRPRDLLPQLAGPARFSAEEASEGLFLVAVGLLKKVAIGDYVALNLVDRVFDAPLQYSGLECYTAVLGYAVQIYCDFSGYTDIAIGIALLIGVRMPVNFDTPYKAPDIVDFWRRWHISLSTWLRDYLYISLGGNRRGVMPTYVNVMITMLLGGLWHGASWSFFIWGGLHGWAMAVTRAFSELTRPSHRAIALIVPAISAGPVLGGIMCSLLWTRDTGLFLRFAAVGAFLGIALAVTALYRDWARRHGNQAYSAEPLRDERRNLVIRGIPQSLGGKAFHVVAVLAAFHVVCAGWIFFRAESFRDAALFFGRLLTFTTYHPNLHVSVLLSIAVGLGSQWVPERWYIQLREAYIAVPAPAQAAALFLAALTIRAMASAEAVPFVYFQF